MYHSSLSTAEICTRYDQAFCSQLPGYGPSDDPMIFVDQLSRGPDAMHLMELEMTESYKKLIGNETKWSPGCDLALKQLICHTTLPFCSKEREREREREREGEREGGREGERERERESGRERAVPPSCSLTFQYKIFSILHACCFSSIFPVFYNKLHIYCMYKIF